MLIQRMSFAVLGYVCALLLLIILGNQRFVYLALWV